MRTYRYFDEGHNTITRAEFHEAARDAGTLWELLEELGYQLSDFDVVTGYALYLYGMYNDIKEYLRHETWETLPEAIIRIRDMHIEDDGLYIRGSEPLTWHRIDDTQEGLELFSDRVYWVLDDDGFFNDEVEEEGEV